MDNATILTTSVAIMLVIAVYSAVIIMRQQRTIDRLTDKLMARSYVEYKSMDGIKEVDASPVHEDEPKGWYDH